MGSRAGGGTGEAPGGTDADGHVVIARAPDGPVEVPEAVARLAAGRFLRPVWQNELGGLTFEMADGARRLFVKWQPPGTPVDLAAEAQRLRWAARFTTVPQVVDQGGNRDGSWLLTTAVPGDNAVTPRWVSDPAAAVRAVGEGLRTLHDTLPVDACPFTWSAEDRVADARRRAGLGQLDPGRWQPEHRHLSVEVALGLVGHPPPVDRLVVCHGDACAPNTLIDPGGRCRGHVDLGSLGVADRWADLAVATWSTVWNYGAGWENELLNAYGVEQDRTRTRYYRLLWDLGP